MTKLFSFIFLLTFLSNSFSQNYWQQEVNYNIQVKLDDVNHTISAFETFEYVNNSPHTLDFIYVHLWANAYKNKNTALAKQLYANKETFLYYADEKDRGWIDSLDFKVDEIPVKWEYDAKHIDIAKIYLNQPLLPGQRIVVSTPFKVKLPSGKISRLGHLGQSYQITQWYPKPAVYDKNGWNQMPYLNQGEFYSEFGSFDVTITLPKNYVLGATGDLQTQSEIDFMNKKVSQTEDLYSYKQMANVILDRNKEKNEFPASDKEYKSVQYTQKNVHDFAWFADKRYHVLKGEVELPHSKRKVTSWALFTYMNSYLWSNAIEYINDGTYYYSLWNGDYPYNQVTAVDGTISAGGGMEYPNVTVIGNATSASSLETVIVHEVGHNWFYGILGSNERVHGWMDEGLNTLNEMRYIATKYPNNKELSELILNGKFHFEDLNHHDLVSYSCKLLCYFGEDQPIETHSADFTSANYGVTMYQKTGLVFHYLKAVLGDEKFDKAMQNYFETWKFKHPDPTDLKVALEKSSTQNLDWLFVDIIPTVKHVDFKIKRVKTKNNETFITLKNKGQVLSPAILSVYTNDKSEEIVTEPFKNKLIINYNSKDVNQVIIDEKKQLFEMFTHNNSWNKKWLFNKFEPLKPELFIGNHDLGRTNIFYLPMIASNMSDQFMAGLVVHNLGIPFKPTQFLIAPMYSFGRKSISGIGEISKTFHPANRIKIVRAGISIKSFGTDNEKHINSYFVGVSPYVYLKIGNRKKASPFSQSVLLQTIYRYDQTFNRNQLAVIYPLSFFDNYTDHLGFLFQNNMNYTKPDFKISSTSRIEYFDNINNGNHVFRSSIELNFSYKYLKNKMKREIELRAYTGMIWKHFFNSYFGNSLDYSYSMSGANGNQDLFLEEYFFNRNQFGNLNALRMENMGGFKSTSSYGLTNGWIGSTNLYVQLPIKPNLFGLFVDYGLFENGNNLESMFNSGIGLRISKFFGLYFPVLMSDNLSLSYGTANYWSKIRFTLRLNFVNKPFNISNLLN
jgi:hypothetical protein